MTSRLIVALDVDSLREAKKLLNKLHKKVKIFKIGPHLFTKYGPEIVKLVKSYKCEVFLDLKLHDIPNTVLNAVKQMVKLKVFMITIHTQGASAMMKAALKGAKEESKKLNTRKPIILGITVLSSFDRKDLKSIGVTSDINSQVVNLARLAKRSGLDGVVLSAREASLVRKACDKNIIIVTPGIRPKDFQKEDQKRVTTPAKAFSLGADYIVVGRPIIKANNPLRAAEDILKEINNE